MDALPKSVLCSGAGAQKRPWHALSGFTGFSVQTYAYAWTPPRKRRKAKTKYIQIFYASNMGVMEIL
jgi:hypothetical protein